MVSRNQNARDGVVVVELLEPLLELLGLTSLLSWTELVEVRIDGYERDGTKPHETESEIRLIRKPLGELTNAFSFVAFVIVIAVHGADRDLRIPDSFHRLVEKR